MNSDSSNEKAMQLDKNLKMHKTYSIGYLTKNIRTNKIYSDDFDADYDILKYNQKMRFKLGSV